MVIAIRIIAITNLNLIWNMSKKLVGYYRVSTHKQGQSGLGMEAQQEQVRRYAESIGGTLLAEHVEVESGTRSARPILAQALADCRRRKAVLIIAKLDRLARNVSFISSLLDSKVEFVCCDVPHADRMLLQMLSVFAEHEARMISERTKAALTAAKARGVILGSYGKHLAAEHKAKATEFALTMSNMIADLKAGGRTTLAAMADALNTAGHPTREGGKWTPMTVQRVVKRLEIAESDKLLMVAA